MEKKQESRSWAKPFGETLTLHNGVTIPQLGLGSYQINEGQEVVDAVRESLLLGYRHIDTASIYQNEHGVGQGFRESGLPRDEVFITSKVWNAEQGYENTLLACENSLKRLQMDYLDLYLIHWPSPDTKLSLATWSALEKLYSEKKVRAIGVSNHKEHHLKDIFKACRIRPMVNQIELHPQFPQAKLQAFCKENNIIIESWAPLTRGKIFGKKPLPQLVEKYSKSAAQIILRWHIQQGLVVLPKSKNISRIKENADVFEFNLEPADMIAMQELQGKRIWADPDTLDFGRVL